MRFSSAATLLALASTAIASTQSEILEAQADLAYAQGVVERLAKDAESKAKPASIPVFFKNAALRFDKATKDAKENEKITPSCDSTATEYNKAADAVRLTTPKLVDLACDIRFTVEVKDSIVETTQQLQESINLLEPLFEAYCPDQSVFSSQTPKILSNLQVVADAFEEPCGA